MGHEQAAQRGAWVRCSQWGVGKVFGMGRGWAVGSQWDVGRGCPSWGGGKVCSTRGAGKVVAVGSKPGGKASCLCRQSALR